MNFSTRFKRGLTVSVLVPGLLAIQPKKVHAEPLSVGGIVASVVVQLITSTSVDGVYYLLSKSKSDQEYDLRHAFLKDKRPSYFITSIEGLKNSPDIEGIEHYLLADHELYRYPNFRQVAKTCPGYAEYIKQLYAELEQDYKKRKVRGFKRVYKKNLLTRNLPGNKPEEDYFEFYELIKKLYQEVLEHEQRDLLIMLVMQGDFAAINQLWNSLNKTVLFEVLSSIAGTENSSQAFMVLMNLINNCGRESAELYELAATILLNIHPENSGDSDKEVLSLLEKALAFKPDDKEIIWNIEALKKLIEMSELSQQAVLA